MRYDRARTSLDRHATYIVAGATLSVTSRISRSGIAASRGDIPRHRV
jgi:hypothetical protein